MKSRGMVIDKLLFMTAFFDGPNIPGTIIQRVGKEDRDVLKNAKSEDFYPRLEYVQKLLSKT